MLLDEATSALDSESERLVGDAIARLRQGRTTLMVTHRLSSLGEADRIIVLEAGRIVEEGTHQELLQRRGLSSEDVEATLAHWLTEQPGIQAAWTRTQMREPPQDPVGLAYWRSFHPERCGDVADQSSVRAGGGKGEADARCNFDSSGAKLQEPQADSVELGRGEPLRVSDYARLVAGADEVIE